MCKIICTLGPATSREKDIFDLIHSGMDVARLNFSHGSLQTHSELIKRVRSARSRAGRGTGILIDLPGPKLRAGARSNASHIHSQSQDKIRYLPNTL